MARESKSTSAPPGARASATVESFTTGDATLVHIAGLVDERFLGFGDVGTSATVVLNVSGMTRMTSFGVRQWLKAMDALPKSISDLYLLGCPTFFVDQLNMVLNFGGTAKVLTVVAPYTCPSCGVESGETVDVLAERSNLTKSGPPEKECARCGGKLEFDETPESYFAFVSKYGAQSIQPPAAQLLSQVGLYTSTDVAAEKPPRIIKLVHGSVTYFRIIGTIGSMFRARPFLVGAEGEVVIDLAEVDRFDQAGQKEWRRLLKSLSAQVLAVTLVDVGEAFLGAAGDTVSIARNIAVASVLVPYGCIECFRTSYESVAATWPMQFGAHVCATCGGSTGNRLAPESLQPLQKASTTAPPASAKVISQRDEILSRAMIDASVAQAGEGATPAVAADDTILGKYKIVRRLSAGGMAEVFLAKQVGIGGFEKPVALKRIQEKLLETRQQAIELFLNEAKIAGRLMHPNIVQVLDVGEAQGALFLAMEYVHGKDLRKVIKKLQQTRTIMPLGEALYIVREVAQALNHAYWSTDINGQRMSVVHRDVSPQNVILSYDGAVKLLDFGVAMSAVTEQAESLIVGKWLYMSPESTTHEQVDHRSDLFSLGVILYLLCSGYMPFTGREPKEIVRKIRAGQYKPLQELVAIPEQLADLVARMLAPNPDDRPQRGQEVAAELADIARQYGIESSSSNIAYILRQLFPNEGAGGAETPAPQVREVVMTPYEGQSASTGTAVDSVSVPSASPIPSVPARRSREISVPAVNASALPGPTPSRTATPVRPRTTTAQSVAPAPPRNASSSSAPPVRTASPSAAPPIRPSSGSVPPMRSSVSSVQPAASPILPAGTAGLGGPGGSGGPGGLGPVQGPTSGPIASPQPGPSSASMPQVAPFPGPGEAPAPWQATMPRLPIAPPKPRTNITGIIITVTVVLLLAVGLFLLVRPG